MFKKDPAYGYETFINEGNGITIKQIIPMSEDCLIVLTEDEADTLADALGKLCQDLRASR